MAFKHISEYLGKYKMYNCDKCEDGLVIENLQGVLHETEDKLDELEKRIAILEGNGK